MNIHIKNGNVVDPVNGINKVRDVYVRDGRISGPFDGPFDRVLDARGMYVFPGLIDVHCHLRDPGFEYKEDIYTGTASAVKGGFTSICPMPNTDPICDNAAVVDYIVTKAKKAGNCNVFPIGAVSKGQRGEELAEIGNMADQGIVAVSDDGLPVKEGGFMMKAMKYAWDYKLFVISHSEDLSLSNKGHMNEGYTSTLLGLTGIPSIAEEAMIARDILISSYTGIPVHIAHISTKGSVDLIRQAKSKGVKVTCETCPHYFTLTEEACLGYNTMAKMNPPLRTSEDMKAIIEGIQDGTIDMIATDHAPHHDDEKLTQFSQASNGIIGFETAFALAFTYLVKSEIISIDQLIRLMSVNPSHTFKLGRGNLGLGSPADIVVIDVDNPFVFHKDETLSKSKNSPYDGWELYGKTLHTIVGGRVVYG